MGFLPDRSRAVIRHILEHNADEFRDNVCVCFEDGETWTYEEALKQAFRSANVLRSSGVQRNENVLIFLPNGKSWLRAWWGVSFLGAVMVPVNTAYKGEMLKHICLDSKARQIIANADLSDRLVELNLDLNIIDASALKLGSHEDQEPCAPIEPWDVHAVIYTSGTTGPSKGVLLSYFRTYSDSLNMLGGRLTSRDTILVDLPLFHVAGLSLAYQAWTNGAKLALRSVFSGTRYWDVIRETGATAAMMLGTMADFLFERPAEDNNADHPVKMIWSAPAVKDPSAFKKRFGIELLATGFGMTETGNVLWTADQAANPKSCGKTRPGLEVRLVDDHDIPVATGKTGELIVRTDLPWVLNSGYRGRAEETALAWRNGWFHTGDLFYCDEDGNYFFADRKKDAIRCRGENISSFEVEREVAAYSDVQEAACVGVPGEIGEEEIKVFVVVCEGSAFDPEGLVKFLIPRMPYFMVPRFVEVVPEFPKTPTMRARKFELRDWGNSQATWDRRAAGIEVKRHS